MHLSPTSQLGYLSFKKSKYLTVLYGINSGLCYTSLQKPIQVLTLACNIVKEKHFEHFEVRLRVLRVL